MTTDPKHRDVELWFRFPLSGKIAAAKTLPAPQYAHVETTIAKLNLNAPSLVTRRRNLLARAAKDANSIDRDEWTRRYLREQEGGRLQEFWPALNYNYHKHWSEKF